MNDDDHMSVEEYRTYRATGALPARLARPGETIARTRGSDELSHPLRPDSDRASLIASYRRARVPYVMSHEQSSLTEAAFMADVKQYAKGNGWLVYHARYAVGSDPGYPDLTCVHPVFGVAWFECKNQKPKSQPSARQVEWLTTIRAAGLHGYLVRPLDMEWIAALLQGYPPAATSDE